jgi:2-polyprenyl-3-methyl-5-hydroxy-6-metoxy-1,4-benzoquinol methylase
LKRNILRRQQDDDYFEQARPEMLRFVPTASRRVLELGCAEGAFASSVKAQTGAEVWGIERNPEAGTRAASVIDRVLVGDADEQIALLPDAYFDTIVCNDVLEHLVDPRTTLAALRGKLSLDGVVVTSLPNIRHLPALSKIVFRRDFPLEDAGIYDRTHLRFFTRKSMRRLFDDAGFDVRSIKGINGYCGPLGGVLILLSLGYFADGYFLQYATVASPKSANRSA